MSLSDDKPLSSSAFVREAQIRELMGLDNPALDEVREVVAEINAERDALKSEVERLRNLVEIYESKYVTRFSLDSMIAACKQADADRDSALAECERMRPVYESVRAYIIAARSKANLGPHLYNELAAPFDAAEAIASKETPK